MLEIIHDLVYVKMFHNIGCNYVFKYFTEYACERYGPIICRIGVSSFLKMGERFALSHSDGSNPSSWELEKMTCRIGAISRQSFCSSRGRIWSGPGALSGFKPCSNLMMPFIEILRSGIFGYLFLM